ncbi:Uncharacterised protein [Acinetobacter baumannii]|nr:Uncharacterised protein [Acinetobacter baumannii]
MSSKVVANTALMSPASENRIAVSNSVSAITHQACTCSGTKNSEMMVTSTPTQIPRATPPPT